MEAKEQHPLLRTWSLQRIASYLFSVYFDVKDVKTVWSPRKATKEQIELAALSARLSYCAGEALTDRVQLPDDGVPSLVGKDVLIFSSGTRLAARGMVVEKKGIRRGWSSLLAPFQLLSHSQSVLSLSLFCPPTPPPSPLFPRVCLC